MSPRQSARGISRESLLTTAAELFAAQGYRATTLDDVASDLGVKKASLYHYISSKEELLIDIYEQMLVGIQDKVEPIAGLDLPPAERLRRMVHAHIAFVAESSEKLTVVFQEESELSEPARSTLRARKKTYETLFEKVIREGQEGGDLRDLPTEIVVMAVLGMTNWMHHWFRPGRDDPSQIAGTFALILESGWLTDDGDVRRAAWPRHDSVSAAMEPALTALDELEGQVLKLREQLAMSQTQLEDGLSGERGAAGSHGIATR